MTVANSEDLARLRTLIDRIKVAMLTTETASGELRARPLHTLELDFDGRLWFFVSARAEKIDEMNREHGRLGLTYSDPVHQDYLSICGHGELSRDRERMKKHWSSWVKVWYPQGLEDPDLALLCVRIEEAEYWNAPASAASRLYALTKARMTGDKSVLGEHRRIGH